MEKNPKNLKQLRCYRNRDLIKRMRSGEPLTSFDSRASWFPPRPMIKKDAEALEKVYGKAAELSQLKKQKKDENDLRLK